MTSIPGDIDSVLSDSISAVPTQDDRFKDFDKDLNTLKCRLNMLLGIIRNTEILTNRAGSTFVFTNVKKAERVFAKKIDFRRLSADLALAVEGIEDIAKFDPSDYIKPSVGDG